MRKPSTDLDRRVRRLVAKRPRLAREAEDFVLQFYRRHRRLPPAYVTALLPRKAVRRLLVRAEIEHALGLARVLQSLARQLRCIRRRLWPALRRNI